MKIGNLSKIFLRREPSWIIEKRFSNPLTSLTNTEKGEIVMIKKYRYHHDNQTSKREEVIDRLPEKPKGESTNPHSKSPLKQQVEQKQSFGNVSANH